MHLPVMDNFDWVDLIGLSTKETIATAALRGYREVTQIVKLMDDFTP